MQCNPLIIHRTALSPAFTDARLYRFTLQNTYSCLSMCQIVSRFIEGIADCVEMKQGTRWVHRGT